MRAIQAVSFLLGLCPLSQADPFPVTGVKTGIDPSSNALPVRRSITEFANSGPAWDLFVQALLSFQAVPEDSQLSYLQISGIHGRPYISWNGVEQANGATLFGYCTHNEPLFGIWHRPYVALFEQVLALHIQSIASDYSGQQKTIYKTAADTWRLPYWDWAVDQELPQIFTSDNLTINGPAGRRNVENPLQTYRFHQFPLNEAWFPPDADLALASFSETLRCPDSKTKQSDPEKADEHVEAIDLAAEVYNFYTRLHTFEDMSTTANSGNSIENLHNEVHIAVGGMHPVGHFAHLGYSGFDPIFMLHHAGIDRHVALWQAIYYKNAMFNSTYATEMGTFATAPGTNISADSPLKPFYADTDGNFHTANSAKDIATFGYTYPELLGDFASPLEKSDYVKSEINRLYGGHETSEPDVPEKRAVKSEVSVEYFVKVELEKADLPLPCVLRIWLEDQLVGRVALLDTPKHGVVHSEIALEGALQTSGLKLEKRTEAVAEILGSSLHWDIIKNDGVLLDGLMHANVALLVEDVRLPQSSSEFPKYGPPKKLLDVSHRVEAGNLQL